MSTNDHFPHVHSYRTMNRIGSTDSTINADHDDETDREAQEDHEADSAHRHLSVFAAHSDSDPLVYFQQQQRLRALREQSDNTEDNKEDNREKNHVNFVDYSGGDSGYDPNLTNSSFLHLQSNPSRVGPAPIEAPRVPLTGLALAAIYQRKLPSSQMPAFVMHPSSPPVDPDADSDRPSSGHTPLSVKRQPLSVSSRYLKPTTPKVATCLNLSLRNTSSSVPKTVGGAPQSAAKAPGLAPKLARRRRQEQERVANELERSSSTRVSAASLVGRPIALIPQARALAESQALAAILSATPVTRTTISSIRISKPASDQTSIVKPCRKSESEITESEPRRRSRFVTQSKEQLEADNEDLDTTAAVMMLKRARAQKKPVLAGRAPEGVSDEASRVQRITELGSYMQRQALKWQRQHSPRSLRLTTGFAPVVAQSTTQNLGMQQSYVARVPSCATPGSTEDKPSEKLTQPRTRSPSPENVISDRDMGNVTTNIIRGDRRLFVNTLRNTAKSPQTMTSDVILIAKSPPIAAVPERSPSPSYLATLLCKSQGQDFAPLLRGNVHSPSIRSPTVVVTSVGSPNTPSPTTSHLKPMASSSHPAVADQQNDVVSVQLASLTRLLDGFFLELPKDQFAASFGAIETVLANLLRRPARDIYRSISKRNPAVQQRICKYINGTRLLTLFGFADVESVAMDSTIDPCENSDQAATLSYQTDVTLSPAVLGPVPSLELPKAQTSGIPPRQSTYARRLTKAEQKEQHEQIYLVLSDATESRVGHSEFLQRALDMVRSQIQSRSKANHLLVNPVTTGTIAKSVSIIGSFVPLTSREQEQLKYKEETLAFRQLIDVSLRAECDMCDFADATIALLALLKNLMLSPPQAKYRKIRVDNGMFHEKIGRWKNAKQFLMQLGFREAGGHLFLLPAFETPGIYARLAVFLSDIVKIAEPAAQQFRQQQEQNRQIDEFHHQMSTEPATPTSLTTSLTEPPSRQTLHKPIDRQLRVFAAADLHLLSRLDILPVLDAQGQDDGDDERMQPGDRELILSAQHDYQDRLELEQQRRIERIRQRTGVDLSRAPEPGGAGASKRKSKRIPDVKKLFETTTIRFIFPEKLVVQAQFHRFESVAALFAFARGLLVNSRVRSSAGREPLGNTDEGSVLLNQFHFFLPPSQNLFEAVAAEDTLAALNLVPAANLHVMTPDGVFISLLPSVVCRQEAVTE